jgi:predicted permease
VTRWRRNEREEDLERELRDHLEIEARERQEEGLSSEEAHFAARRLFGNTTLVKEEVREIWGWMWLDRLWQDLRYGGRGLYKSPVFTLVSVLSLALGIGATVTVFSVFEAVFFNAVTAKDVGRVKHVEIDGQRFSYLYYEKLSAGNPMLAGVAAYDQASLSLRSGNDLEKITGDIVSGNFFSVLGVAPFLGRTFTGDEGRARNQPRVVVLSHGFWERKFRADVNVLGRAIELNREPFTIVGVLPKGYRSIHGYGITPDVYVPISTLLVGELDNPGNARLRLIARLQDGVSVSQAQASIHAAAQQWRQRYPGETLTPDQVRLDPLTGLEKMHNDGVPVELAMFFVFLLLAGGLVLLIACGNVGGLLLARGANRSREIAVRLALGAPRHHLLQQLLTESFLLAFLGAGAGMALYVLTSALLDRIQIRLSFPLEVHLNLDARALAFAIALALLATLLSGLTPAVQAGTSSSLVGSRRIGEARRSLRRILVIGQFALAFVLLVSAALFLRSLARIGNVDPGFDVKHLLTAEVSLDPNSYSQKRAERYFEAAMTEIGRLPGVRSVSGADIVPLGLEHSVMSMKAGERIIQRVHVNSVTPGYFRTMGIRLLQGRDFEASDRAGGLAVAIVNETFARKYLQNHAVAAQVLVPAPSQPPIFSGVQVVGVVADSKYGTLGEEPTAALYWPWSQRYSPLVLQISSDAPLAGNLTAVGEVLTRLDPHVPVKLQLMQERLAGALLPSRIASALLGIIGSLGLLLAAIGIYGVMAYSVSQRTAEIGLRMAIGATRMQVQQMILRDAFLLVSAGMALGLAMAMLVTRMLSGVLAAGISAVDPLSFGPVGVLLATIALFAALIPAWRASHVDPVVALRHE